jgi:hypothetical protein
MQITNQSGVIIVEHNGMSLQMTPEELEVVRGLSPAALRQHARDNMYPSAGKKERAALTEILRAADELPAAFEEFDAPDDDDNSGCDAFVPC